LGAFITTAQQKYNLPVSYNIVKPVTSTIIKSRELVTGSQVKKITPRTGALFRSVVLPIPLTIFAGGMLLGGQTGDFNN